MPLKFLYEEFLNLDSEIYWKKSIATISDLELLEYSGDIIDFTYDVFPLYKCKVKYTFEFNNQTYIGNTISSETSIEGDTINKTIYEKLYNSKKVIVWVNKRNPKQSSLTKKSIITEQLFTAIGILMLPLSILNLIKIRRKNNSFTLINKLEIYNDR
ncbi:DUF3592 domain-containing protein [Flavobacteriaceae bacterium]|nr:DUF3592 domain-containing protein [Flavobacteriaceae bacterium]